MLMPEDEYRVQEIVASGRERNRALGITGVLMFTEEHFAHFIEGDETSVADLMASIKRDLRHTDVNVIETLQRPSRLFPEWPLAYAGPEACPLGLVEPLLTRQPGEARDASVERLIYLGRQVAKP